MSDDTHSTRVALVPFLFRGRRLVRTFTRDHKPWLAAVDLCANLGLKNVAMAVANLTEREKSISIADGVEGLQGLWMVSESGAYALIFRSRRPEAEEFRLWVTEEVLPALRQDGVYAMPGKGPDPADGERWKFAKVAEVRLTFGHKAAQQMYFALGLMRVPAMHEPPAQREMFDGEPGDNVIALLPKE